MIIQMIDIETNPTIERVRNSGYHQQLRDLRDTNPEEFLKLSEKELCDYIAIETILKFNIITLSDSRQMLVRKNMSYGFDNDRIMNYVNKQLGFLNKGSYKAMKNNIIENIKDQTLFNPNSFNGISSSIYSLN